MSLETLLIKDGDLLLRYKYMDSLQESYFCIVTLMASAQTGTLRIRADPMEAL